MIRAAVKPLSIGLQILRRDVMLSRLEKRLERDVELAFLTWCNTRTELPGPKWSHVTDPLFARWQELEQALAFVRCL